MNTQAAFKEAAAESNTAAIQASLLQHLWLYDAQSMQLLTANALRIGTKYKTLRSSCQAGGGE